MGPCTHAVRGGNGVHADDPPTGPRARACSLAQSSPYPEPCLSFREHIKATGAEPGSQSTCRHGFASIAGYRQKMSMTNQREEPAGLSALVRSLDEVRQVVGDSNITRADVDAGQQGENVRRTVSLFRPRDVRAVIRPGSVQEIQAIVRIFHGNNPPAGLHAISTGRNWGLGSAEPATDDVVTVDLGRMNSVRRVDCDAGYAVIEPGVTQLCLAEALDGTNRMLNVTASSGHTSVIGNALERGVGIRRQRTEDLLGLAIVLSDGEFARLGRRPGQNRRTAANPYGLGPSLLHLFTQSNLGIVAAAVVSLLPRPESQRVPRLKFPCARRCRRAVF